MKNWNFAVLSMFPVDLSEEHKINSSWKYQTVQNEKKCEIGDIKTLLFIQ